MHSYFLKNVQKNKPKECILIRALPFIHYIMLSEHIYKCLPFSYLFVKSKNLSLFSCLQLHQSLSEWGFPMASQEEFNLAWVNKRSFSDELLEMSDWGPLSQRRARNEGREEER